MRSWSSAVELGLKRSSVSKVNEKAACRARYQHEEENLRIETDKTMMGSYPGGTCTKTESACPTDDPQILASKSKRARANMQVEVTRPKQKLAKRNPVLQPGSGDSLTGYG